MGEGTPDLTGGPGTAGKGDPALQRVPPALVLGVSDPKSFLRGEDKGGRYMKEGEVEGNYGSSPDPPPRECALSRGTR